MDQLPKYSLEEVKSAFVNSFFNKLKDDIQQQQTLLKTTDQLYCKYHEKLKRLKGEQELTKYINETEWLKNSLYDLLEAEFPERREIPFEEEFIEFKEKAGLFLESIPEEIKIAQAEERFQKQAEDSFWVGTLKSFKTIGSQLSKIPRKTANLFRKNKKPLTVWTQEVPLKAMVQHFFVNQFVHQSLPLYKELQLIKCNALNLKWTIDRDINLEIGQFLAQEKSDSTDLLEHINTIAERNRIPQNIESLNERLEKWEGALNQTIEKLYQQFNFSIERVDTFELSISEFSKSKVLSAELAYKNLYISLFNGWRNTLFAQLDDFQLDIEFYHIKYKALLQLSLLQNSCRLRINGTVDQNLHGLTQKFESLEKDLQANSKDKSKVKGILIEEKEKLNHALEKRLIPEAIESIYNQNLPYLLDRFELKLKQQIEKMKDQRIIYAENDYNAPISKSDLSHFNPKELVLVDSFKHFTERNQNVKSRISHQIEKVEQDLKELIGIVDYNLDSALNSELESGKSEDVVSVALEGISRVKAKVEQTKQDLLKVQSIFNQELKTGVDKLNQSIIKLTDNENITALRLQLATAKAIEKTKEYRKNLLENAKQVIPLAYRYLRAQITKLASWVESTLRQAGIVEEKQELTAELSDFLVQSELAIQKLPYVYRRLYRVEPLEEEIFFEGRIKELNSLNKAHQSWQEGNFSNVCIVGEKGSGASSLINFFLNEINHKRIVRHKFYEAHSSKDDFILLFQRILGKNSLISFEAIVDYLNSGDLQMIILEDVQHLFLKKIKGFEALNMLFELISLSSKKVFWITEFTSYTWNYLQRTISIERYFKHSIQLSNLSQEQIIELIMKRHRVSGYDLRFESLAKQDSGKRRIRKISDEEEQQNLKNNFFKKLNAFAQSNISLALLYWIRSTKQVEDNAIIIGEIKELKFEFLQNLQDQYIFTLHNLLIHDSLDLEEHAQIFHQSEEQSRMILMVLEDNGVLKSSGNRYYINRMLYRQTVNVLKNKNILH